MASRWPAGVDRGHVPDRAAGGLGRGALRTPRRARRRPLPHLRHQDLHHLWRARPRREHRPPGARADRPRPAGTKGIRCSSCPSSCRARTARRAGATTCAASRSSTSWACGRARPASWPMATTRARRLPARRAERRHRCMFTMMNNARLAVGIRASASPSAPTSRPSPMPANAFRAGATAGPGRDRRLPDVRRMLLTMRAQIAAMRALPTATAAWMDRSQRHADADERRRAADRVALLTPMVKAWCTDLARRDRHMASRSMAASASSRRPAPRSICATRASCRSTRAPTASRPWIWPAASSRSPVASCPGACWRSCATSCRDCLPDLVPPLAAAFAAVERTTRHLQDSPPDDRAAGPSPICTCSPARWAAFSSREEQPRRTVPRLARSGPLLRHLAAAISPGPRGSSYGRCRQSRRSSARRLILSRAAYAAYSGSGSGGSTAPSLELARHGPAQ